MTPLRVRIANFILPRGWVAMEGVRVSSYLVKTSSGQHRFAGIAMDYVRAGDIVTCAESAHIELTTAKDTGIMYVEDEPRGPE